MLRCHLIPTYGSCRLDQITAYGIRDFIQAKRAEGYSRGTVNRMLSVLKTTLAKALEWEVAGIKYNPARVVKQLRDPPKIDRFLGQEEAEHLFEELLRSNSPMLKFIVPFLLLTGARKREALDAQWRHIDFERNLWTIPETKAGKPRYVPLSPQALAVLDRLGPLNKSRSKWLFPSPETGKPYSSIFHAWDRCRKAAGVPDLRIHDLRHSFASAMIDRGMTIYDVKEALGHANVSTTQRYAHLSRDRLREAVYEAGAHYASALSIK